MEDTAPRSSGALASGRGSPRRWSIFLDLACGDLVGVEGGDLGAVPGSRPQLGSRDPRAEVIAFAEASIEARASVKMFCKVQIQDRH